MQDVTGMQEVKDAVAVDYLLALCFKLRDYLSQFVQGDYLVVLHSQPSLAWG